MEVFPASVVLIIRALVVSARWAGRSRRRTLVRVWSGSETAAKAFSWESEQRRIGTIEACRCRRHIRGIGPCPMPRGSPGVVSQGLDTMTDLGLRAAARAPLPYRLRRYC